MESLAWEIWRLRNQKQRGEYGKVCTVHVIHFLIAESVYLVLALVTHHTNSHDPRVYIKISQRSEPFQLHGVEVTGLSINRNFWRQTEESRNGIELTYGCLPAKRGTAWPNRLAPQHPGGTPYTCIHMKTAARHRTVKTWVTRVESVERTTERRQKDGYRLIRGNPAIGQRKSGYWLEEIRLLIRGNLDIDWSEEIWILTDQRKSGYWSEEIWTLIDQRKYGYWSEEIRQLFRGNLDIDWSEKILILIDQRKSGYWSEEIWILILIRGGLDTDTDQRKSGYSSQEIWILIRENLDTDQRKSRHWSEEMSELVIYSWVSWFFHSQLTHICITALLRFSVAYGCFTCVVRRTPVRYVMLS